LGAWLFVPTRLALITVLPRVTLIAMFVTLWRALLPAGRWFLRFAGSGRRLSVRLGARWRGWSCFRDFGGFGDRRGFGFRALGHLSLDFGWIAFGRELRRIILRGIVLRFGVRIGARRIWAAGRAGATATTTTTSPTTTPPPALRRIRTSGAARIGNIFFRHRSPTLPGCLAKAMEKGALRGSDGVGRQLLRA
jgi:hypothetical protein